jgi:hypothetical protein
MIAESLCVAAPAVLLPPMPRYVPRVAKKAPASAPFSRGRCRKSGAGGAPWAANAALRAVVGAFLPLSGFLVQEMSRIGLQESLEASRGPLRASCGQLLQRGGRLFPVSAPHHHDRMPGFMSLVASARS